MDFIKQFQNRVKRYYLDHEDQIIKALTISLKVLMFITTLCALVGLSALVFFMCEQAMFDFGITSWAIVYISSAVGAGIVFLAHVATWGKESFKAVDWILGDLKEDNNYLPKTTGQKVLRAFFVAMSFLGTAVYSFSSYLGFLSMATALGATGLGLFAIQAFGIICSGAMLVSAGLFNMNSMLHELDVFFEKINQKRLKLQQRAQRDPNVLTPDNVKQYKNIKERNKLVANVTSYVLAVGNALGDVIFKSFAFSHWLVLIGLAAVSSTGVITFSGFGFFLLGLACFSTFSLSMTTEGIRMVSIGEDISKRISHKSKAMLIPGKKIKEAPKLTTLQKFGRVIGNFVAVFVSLMTSIPALTSSISKVAGLGAFILWFIPGMQTLAFVLSLSLGTFFFISKFIGYYGQSGPYIINAVSDKTQSYQSTYRESFKRLTSKIADDEVMQFDEAHLKHSSEKLESPSKSGLSLLDSNEMHNSTGITILEPLDIDASTFVETPKIH